MSENTNDLSQFGMRELAIAGDLLREYSNGTCDFLTDGVKVEFNPNSGVVFLVDEDFNVGVLEDDVLVQLFSCPNCGFEGTQEDALAEGKDFEKFNGYCSKECEKENE
jgi:hypothetical protein